MNLAAKFALTSAFFLCCACAFAADVAVLNNGFSIRHEQREVVGSVTRLYLGDKNSGYVDVPTADINHFEHAESLPAGEAQQPTNLNDVVSGASDRYRLDPDLVNSVINAESGFHVKAVSRKGAQGLMQLMPATASSLGVTNAFNPKENVEGGTRYLRELLERYNFDVIKALTAYNAGPQRVEQYHGIPPYYETQAYVARIVRDFNRKKLAQQKAAAAKAKLGTSKKASDAPSTRDASVKQTADAHLSQEVSR